MASRFLQRDAGRTPKPTGFDVVCTLLLPILTRRC
jgi:hypothetical protein